MKISRFVTYDYLHKNLFLACCLLKNISVSDVLSHRAGLPYVEQPLTAEDAYDWNRITSLLAAQKPQWEPGSTHGSHSYTFGFLAGELVRRVDPQHRSCGQFVRDELDPEFFIGVPDGKVEARVAPLIRKEVRYSLFSMRLFNISYFINHSEFVEYNIVNVDKEKVFLRCYDGKYKNIFSSNFSLEDQYGFF